MVETKHFISAQIHIQTNRYNRESSNRKTPKETQAYSSKTKYWSKKMLLKKSEQTKRGNASLEHYTEAKNEKMHFFLYSCQRAHDKLSLLQSVFRSFT